MKKLGEIGSFLGGGTPSKSNTEYWIGKVPWISSSDIYKDDINNISITRFINENAINSTAAKIIPRGSVLFVSRVGVGKLAINKEELCTSQDFTNFLPKKDILNFFVGYYFSSNKNLLQSLNQGTSIKGFTKSDLENFRFSYPKNIKEQQKIAACLTSIDDLITAEAQKLDALKTHKKGLMQQLFPCEGEVMPRLRFPEFRDAGDWEEKTLAEVAKYENGKAHEQRITENGDFIVVNSKFISTEGAVRKFSDTAFCIAKKQDILMVLSDVPNGRAIAKCFQVDADNLYSVNQRICKITPTNAVSVMLFYSLNRNRYFLAFDDGVKQTNLKKDDVLECPIILPKSMPEQQKIAACLTSIDNLITSQAQKLNALKTHKKGLMQQLFPTSDEVKV